MTGNDGPEAGGGIAVPLRLLTRAAISLALLALLASFLDAERIAARLVGMRPGWVGLALAVSVLQVGLSAWRWQFTARRLGLRLRFREALAEYYLATFLNQVLPGGVIGDLSRAWRHGRVQRASGLPDGRAVRAVILERASGQAVMLALAVVSVAWLPLPGDGGRRIAVAGGVLACGALAAGSVWQRRRRTARRGEPPLTTPPVTTPPAASLTARFWNDTRMALLSRGAAPVQLVTSSAVVASYVAVYVLAARAVDVDVPLRTLVPLVAPVLVSMLVPVTIAGWGIREGSAALVFAAARLPAVDGVAASMAYGLLVLLSSLPGAVILLLAIGRRAGTRAPDTPPDPCSDQRPHRSSRS